MISIILPIKGQSSEFRFDICPVKYQIDTHSLVDIDGELLKRKDHCYPEFQIFKKCQIMDLRGTQKRRTNCCRCVTDDECNAILIQWNIRALNRR